MTALAFEKMADSAPNATIQLDALAALSCMQDTLEKAKERQRPGPPRILRPDLAPPIPAISSTPPTVLTTSSTPSAAASTSSVSATATTPISNPELQTTKENEGDAERDAGVSDDVCEQLQRDLQAAEARNRELEEVTQRIREAEEEEQHRLAELAEAAAEEERVRLQALADKARKEAARLAEEKSRKEEARKREAAIQHKIRQMGVCVQGYRWIQQGSGYRCGGGSHFLSNSQLGI
jgi:DNA repair exonuclease SbcCD ATPase subunit